MSHTEHREEVFLPPPAVYDHSCNIFDERNKELVHRSLSRITNPTDTAPSILDGVAEKANAPLNSHNAVEQIYGP